MADDAPIFVVVDDEPTGIPPRQPFAPLEVAAPAAAGRGAGGAPLTPAPPLAAAPHTPPHAWSAKAVGRASLDGTAEFDDIEPVRRAAGRTSGEQAAPLSRVPRRRRRAR